MTRWMWTLPLLVGVAPLSGQVVAQEVAGRSELRSVMDDFVRGWREGDAELLSRVVDMDEGRITWVSGQGANEQVESMTFAAAVARNRTHPEYGRDGWELVSLDVVDDGLAFAKLRIPEGDAVSIDFMVCYRVAGTWRIVSNTFVIQGD